MNKNKMYLSLLSIAVFTGFFLAVNAVAAEAAGPQVYGQLRLSLDSVSNDSATGAGEGISVISNASRIGVKGSMDTEVDGIQFIYQAELRYEGADEAAATDADTSDPANKNKSVEFREGYGGLKGGWGQLRLGRLNTAYKSSLTSIDPWNDNAPQSRSSGRQGSSEFHSSYFNNAIDYASPKLAGVITAHIWHSSQFDQSTKPLHNTSTLSNYIGGTATGAGLKYKNDNLELNADTLKINADSTNGKAGLVTDESGMQISGRYKFGSNSMAALYEDVEELGLGKNTYINYIRTQGNMRYIVGYGANTDSTVYGTSGIYSKDYENISLGIKYAATKKSELFVAYNNRTTDPLSGSSTDETTITAGFNIKFGY